ncbi:MAG: Co2+/Mg2+ efflux protein ApaG [Cellvibrionaceae bacterium]|nr:Co2+/Mg2+ efflux protein ApaG [Cellvibrionaceae bacterium]
MKTPPHSIIITVTTEALESPPQLALQTQRFVFSYTVTIENRGEHAAQLLERHWLITDANNTVQDVRGAGVVGEQPRIVAGAGFTYSSHALLATPAGTMEGSYTMQTDQGERFTVPIPLFMLGGLHALH